MNHSKIFWISVIALMGLSSCVNEEIPAYEHGAGKMQLQVDVLQPKSTRAIDTKDFPVNLLDAEGNPLKEHQYAKLSEMPKQIQLPVGEYAAESYSPGEFEKIMDVPFYKGVEHFDIQSGLNTKVEVICRMANGSFEVKFSESFHEVFSKGWNISIDDGTETAIMYNSITDELPLPKKYLRFEEETSKIYVNFIGVTSEGSRITMSNTLTKEQASEQYDDDNEFFSGGDAIVLNFTPVESTEGTVTGITLTANIQFEESDKEYNLEVTDKNTSGGGESGDTPGESDENSITLDLPNDMTVSATTDPSLGDTYIAAENGLKSIVVKMSSTSGEMISSLETLSGNYSGVDFINGAEVVDNQEMVKLFSDLSQTLQVPSEGDTEYTFPIGNFFMLLAFLPGEHTFDLIITDMDGNTKDGVLKLTVE